MNCELKALDFIPKGVDTNALGGYWFTLNVDTSELPEGQTISKVEVVCEPLVIPIVVQSFPIEVNLTVEQTRQLKIGKNTVYLYGYDGNNRRFKFDGKFEFILTREA